MSGKVARFLLAAFLACAAARCRAEDGGTGQFGVRVSGGYGFSLSDQVDENPAGQEQRVPMSAGIASSAELLYALTPRLGLDLGVYPDFISRPEREWEPSQNVDNNVTFLPVLLGLELKEPVARSLDVIASVGFGVVPATTFYRPAVAPSTGNRNAGYDAALALRFYLGIRERISEHLGVLLGIQNLTFDPPEITSQGQTILTDDINQLAPLVGVDWIF